MAQAIATLTPGQAFVLAALPTRQGTLVRLGEGSAVVRYSEARTHTFTARLPGEAVQVAFTAPSQAVTISLATLVEVL